MAKNEAKPKTNTYVLKTNAKHHGFKDGVRHTYVGSDPENNKVELTEAQFKQFKDKFITEASAKELQTKSNELAELKKKQAAIEEALKAKGVSVEDLLAETAKKPDPTPSVGTNEPTPTNVTPAPTGSTPDPVNQPPAAKTEAKK